MVPCIKIIHILRAVAGKLGIAYTFETEGHTLILLSKADNSNTGHVPIEVEKGRNVIWKGSLRLHSP